MKKAPLTFLFLALTAAVLFPFLSGIYAVFPEQALRRQERAYLVTDTEILLKVPREPDMGALPEYLFITRDEGHHYLGCIEGKLYGNFSFLGHWVPTYNLKVYPRGELLSILPGWIGNFETTETQREKTSLYVGESLPIYVFDEQLQGDTIRGTIETVYAANTTFYNLHGLGLRFYAESELDAKGIGTLTFNDHDFELFNITDSMNLSGNRPLYAASKKLHALSAGTYSADLQLELLKDGEVIHTETITLNP